MTDVPSEAPHKVAGKGLSKLKNLPPWAIVIAVGVVIIFVIYLRGRSQSNNTTSAQDTGMATGTTDPYAGAYTDPSMYGAFGSGGGAFPSASDGTLNGGGTDSHDYNVTTSDSHDVNTSDSHDISSTITNTFGDINSPFETVGGGPPIRPPKAGGTNAPPKTKPKVKPGKPKKPPKKGIVQKVKVTKR